MFAKGITILSNLSGLWTIGIPALLLVAVIFVLIARLRRTASKKVQGIAPRYQELIRFLKSEGKPELERVGQKSITLKVRVNTDYFSYVLREVDGRMIVVWTLESPVHGRRGKEWSFDSTYCQEKMFEEIKSDLSSYQKSLQRESR